jgi:hypothetical protein
MASGEDRRRSERYPTASIPVQLSDVNAELIDLSLHGAAVVDRGVIPSCEESLESGDPSLCSECHMAHAEIP